MQGRERWISAKPPAINDCMNESRNKVLFQSFPELRKIKQWYTWLESPMNNGYSSPSLPYFLLKVTRSDFCPYLLVAFPFILTPAGAENPFPSFSKSSI